MFEKSALPFADAVFHALVERSDEGANVLLARHANLEFGHVRILVWRGR